MYIHLHIYMYIYKYTFIYTSGHSTATEGQIFSNKISRLLVFIDYGVAKTPRIP